MKKLLFLYNTHAGKGLLKSRLAAVQDALAAAGWDVTIHPTQGAGDATAVAAARAGEFDRIVCSGGDGTLHEVVAGLMGLENRPEVGYIPAGTTNDFAKNLSLPRGMEAMARVAAAGVPRPVDIGSFNDRYFIYVAAFGAFTDVAYSTPQPVKNIFGHLAYVLEGATRLGSIQAYPLTVEHDGGVEEGGFCYGMVSNTVSVGGFKGMPAEPVRLDDGLFEVVLVRQPQNPLQLQAVIKALLTMSPDEGGLVIQLPHQPPPGRLRPGAALDSGRRVRRRTRRRRDRQPPESGDHRLRQVGAALVAARLGRGLWRSAGAAGGCRHPPLWACVDERVSAKM